MVSQVLCSAYGSQKFWQVAERVRFDGIFWKIHAAFCPDMKDGG